MTAIDFAAAELALQPPRPGQILDDVEAMLRRYVAFPSDHAATAATLWTAHTHVYEAFDSTPRLAVLSPEPGSGKTRLLEVLGLLTARPLHAVNTTVSAMFRLIEIKHPTLLFDEADTYFGPKAAQHHEELRGLVNAGHRAGASAARCVGEGAKMTVKEFPAFCPVALAGLGDLPDTILHRSIIIRMRRRAPDEHVEPLRYRTARAEAEPLHERLQAWGERAACALAEAEPDTPLQDRPADVWEALLAIADDAGDAWPDRARAAAVALTAGGEDRAEPSLGLKLLEDLRTVWGDAPHHPTADLLTLLAALDESPWSDLFGKPLNAHGLGRRLHPYGVTPTQIKAEGVKFRGYLRQPLADAWVRYLPSPDPSVDHPDGSGTSETSGTPQVSPTSEVPLVPDVPLPTGARAEVVFTPPESPCVVCGVTCAVTVGGVRRHPNCPVKEAA